MSHSEEIKAAGNKISAFVESKGGDSSKVEQGISKSNKALEDNEDSDDYGDAADATVATFEAVLGSIDKFESGDPTQIAIGVLDILAEVSAFASLTGPQGAIVAAVVGPLCTIISSLLGAGTEEAPESDEDMMERVVTEALAVATYQDLQDTASGVTQDLKERMGTVKVYLANADELGSGDRESIRSDTSRQAGSEFLGKLLSHIERDIGNKDDTVAGRTATLITAYSSVVFVRCQYLYMLSSLIGGDPDAQITAIATMQLAETQKEISKNLLKGFLKRPGQSNHVLYSKVFLQPQSSLDLIQALCEEESEGKLMKIYNTTHKNYLQVDKSNSNRSEAKTTDQARFWEMPSSTKFVVFGKDKLEIFSLAHAGYVYAADYNPYDENRRRVNGWKPGHQINQGHWKSSVVDKNNGSVRLRNIYMNEYLYASQVGASGGRNPVYTWRPGNPVNQGYWIFEDCVPPKPKNTTRIRSVSSGNYLDGRNTYHMGLNQIYLSKPRLETHGYFDWELIKLDNGTYNIKSLTSNMYLDGRHEGIGNGAHVKLVHLTSHKARTINYFAWRIKKYNYEGRTRYAIQSVTSKLYLDGRNPEHIGAKLYLTERNPQGDRHLMWELPDMNQVGRNTARTSKTAKSHQTNCNVM